MELNHPMSIFAITQQQQQLSQNQLIPQPYVRQRVPSDPQLPGFHSSRIYRGSDYYNSYAQEGPRQYSLPRMSPMSFPMNFQPECKPYSYTPASQNLMQGIVHYDPGHPSPSDRNMYPYPRPSSSSQYSYITSHTGTETFTQDGILPSVFQSNQPTLPSPASCSYAESHLGSSPVYLQNQSTPSYNKDHRSSLQKVVGVPQEVYGNMAAEDLFFIKASQYGIQVMEKQSGCKDMKVEQVIDTVKEEKANLFKTKASQNGIMIESPPETKKTLDFLPIAKEEKVKDNNTNCSFLLDVQAKTNASAIKKVQWYNSYGENVSNKFEVDGESMARKAGSIYSASWSAEKFTSILDTDNRYSKFAEQSRLSPTQIWMMDGKHEDISRDGSLEGIEQTVLDALNLQEVAWETEDDDALSWEVEMAQEEKVEGKEEGQSLGVELEDEERIKEAAKCLVETIITGALRELGEEEQFSEEEEKKVDDYQSETKVDDYQSETKDDYWSESKLDDYQSETRVDDYQSESKVDDYQSETKVDDYQSETKVDDYWSESNLDDYRSETRVDDYQSETKVDDYWSESKVCDYWSVTKVGDYWSDSEVGDYWSEIVTEGKEISTTEEQSVAREIVVDSVIHTLDDPGSVGDDPGLMFSNRSSEIEKNDLKENKVFQKQPQNKEFDSVLINDSLILKSMDGVILKSTDGDIKGHTGVCASKVDGQFERSLTSPPFCFEFNPELPEFKPGLKKIGDNWKKAYAINMDAPEEFRASLNAVTENTWVIDDRMINFEASDFQMKTYLDVGQEHENSASHKIVLKLNTDCPEFKPESRKISTIRPDAPEFTPSLKTFFQPPDQDITCKIKPKAKVLHLVMPKVVEKFKSVDIQASVEVKDASSLTRKVKTRDKGTYTGSCDCRDVCVNTLESMACEKSKFYIPKEVMLLSTKSVSCGTEPQSTESIGINTHLGSYNTETDLIEKLKQAQMELIQCRADLHVLQLQQTISKLKKEKKTLMEVFIGGEDKVLIDQIIDKRILKSRQEILNIEVSAKSWVKQIQMGQILDSVPTLLFETETQGLRPAVGDFYQPVHMSPCKVIVSPVHRGFDAINIDSYKMDMSNDRVMSSSKGPSLVDIKSNEYTDLRVAGPVFGKSRKPCLSPVDSIQAEHSVGPNGEFSPEIIVSQRYREFSAQSTSPQKVTIQQMGAELRVQDSQTTNTLPVKDWWYLDESIEDTRKAGKVQRSQSLVQKVQRSQSLVQKAEHLDEGPGKNDVKVQGSDVEVKIGTHSPWQNMMLDREGSEDVEVKSDTHPPWHNMMLDREGSEDVEVKTGTQPPWHNMMLDREGSEDVEVKSDTHPPWHNMMLDREGSEDVEVKSGTQPPWHNMMLEREGSEDVEVKSEIQPPSHNRMLDREGNEDVEVKNGTQPPWHNMMLDREGREDVEVKSDTQLPWHNMTLDGKGSEDVEVKSDTQPPWHNMTLDREVSEDVEVKSDTQPPWHNMMLNREGSKDVEVKSGTQPPWYNMLLDREGSEDVEVKSDIQPPSHSRMLDREGNEDVEVKNGTQPPWHNMMLDREGREDVEIKSDTQPPWHNMMLDGMGSEDVEVKSDTQPPWHNMTLDREGSEDVEVKSDTQPPWHNMMLNREGSKDVEVKSGTQPPWHNMMLDREGSEDVEVKSGTQPLQHDMTLSSEDVEVKSDTQPPWQNMTLDGEGSKDVEVKSDTKPPWHNMMLDREGSEDVEVKSDTQPPWHNMMLDGMGSEDVEVKSDTQPPWHNMTLDREGNEDVEVKSDTQPPWHNMMLNREGSKDVEVKSGTQPPWHNMMLDREGSEDVEVKSDTQPLQHDMTLSSEDVEVKSDTQPPWQNMTLDGEGSKDVEVKSDTKPPWHDMTLDGEGCEDVEVKSVTQPPWHNMMLDREGSEDDAEGTQNDSLDRDRQLKESEPDLKIIVNFNSALPIVNEKGVMITHRISEGEISGSEKEIKKKTSSDIRENAVKSTLLGSDEAMIFAESVRKTEAVTDFQENKLSVCCSGFESMKVGSFDHSLEKDQDTSNIKVTMDSEKDYIKEINSNNNDINVVNSDTLCSALKFEVSDLSIMSKTKDVSSNKSRWDPISTETLVHDLIVNSLEDSHFSVRTGETVVVKNDVTTNELLPSNRHCSIAVDATDPEKISSSLFRYEMPLGDSVGITDSAIISVSGSVSKKCSQINHASINELTIIDGISSRKSSSPSMEQQAVVVSTAEPTTYSDSIKTKTESEVGFSPVNDESVLNLANEAVPNLDSGAVTISGVLDPADAEGVSVPGMTFFSPGLNPAEGFTPGLNPAEGFTPGLNPAEGFTPGLNSAEGFTPVPMPSLSSLFMPAFSMPQVQTNRLEMPSEPQRSITSPPIEGMVLATQKGISDPAGGIMGVDHILYQTVLAQIMKAYPDLSKNSEMLRSLALQQTTLLQFYISGGEGHFNLTEPVLQSSVQPQLGTTGPCRLWTEFEGTGMNVLVHSDSKESTDIPKKPLAPPPGNLPTVFSSESSCSTSVSKGFDFTSAVESALKPIDGASSSVPTSELSFSFANTAGSFTATAKIDTKTKSETTHSNLHPNLSVTSKTDQVHSKAAQEDDAEENINSAAEIETSTQTRTSSSSDCHKNELDVLHKNKELLIQDVESPKLSGSHLGSTQTKPSGSLQNLHGASSNREPPGQDSYIKKSLMPQPGQASNEKKTLMPQPGQASNEKTTLMPQPGQAINEKKPLMPQPGQASNEKKTLMPQPGQASNEKKTLMPQPGQASNEKETLMPQPGQASNEKKTLMPQPGQASNEKKILMPQPGQASNEKKTLMPQPGQASNEKKTLMPQPGQASNEKKTLMPQPGQASNEKKTLMPQPDFASYPVMLPWAAQPSILQPRFGSNLMIPLMAAQPQLILSQYVKPNGLPNLLSPIMAQPRVCRPRVMQPQFKQHQPQKPHFMKPQHSLPSGWQHGFPQSTLGLPQNVRQQNFSSPADEHNDSTKGASNHNITRETSVPHRTPDFYKYSITVDMPVPQRTLGSDDAETSEFTKTVKSNPPADKFISNFVRNEISKSAEKLNVSGLCPITTQSTAFRSKLAGVGSDSTVVEPKLGSPFGSEEAGQPDFLPSFVKTDQYTSTRKHTPPVSKTTAIPELMKTQSWRGATWDARENWDDEVDEYPKPFKLEHNVKREITGFNGSYSAVVKPRDSKLTIEVAKVKRKIEETNSTNPWASRVQGHQGIVTSDENYERKEGKKDKQEESWTEVTKKKKKDTSKQESFASNMTKLGTVSQTKASNFEKLIQKLMECFSNMTRSELTDVITQVRKSRGGSLSGMTMKDIVDKAGEIVMAKQHQKHKAGEVILAKQHQKHKSPCFEDVEKEEDICVICHDGLSMEETKTLDCGHIFHFQCIKQWVLGRERTCPNCRSLALFPEEFPHLCK